MFSNLKSKFGVSKASVVNDSGDNNSDAGSALDFDETSFRLEADPDVILETFSDGDGVSLNGIDDEDENENENENEVPAVEDTVGILPQATVASGDASGGSTAGIAKGGSGTPNGDKKKRGSIFDSFKSTMNNVGISVTSDLTDDTSYMKVKDPKLIAIGKQMRQLEQDCLKNDDKLLKEWIKNDKGALEKDIKELEQTCTALKTRLDKEVSHGLEHLRVITEELDKQTSILEGLKKK
jgi:hypothetical protein